MIVSFHFMIIISIILFVGCKVCSWEVVYLIEHTIPTAWLRPGKVWVYACTYLIVPMYIQNKT